MKIVPPVLDYSDTLLQHIKNYPKHRKRNLGIIHKKLGYGVWGKVYSGEVARDPSKTQIVIKKLEKGGYTNNEFEALFYLRQLMIDQQLPAYYNFMYGCYSRDDHKYFILERCDGLLVDVMESQNWDTSWYREVYSQVIDAVNYLEKLKFNHGDLWDENIMVKYKENNTFQIVLIDFDSAYREDSLFTKPAVGGGYFHRKLFMLGYDMNRYFDAVRYNHTSYLRKREKAKRKLALKLDCKPETLDQHPEIETYDEVNIIFPKDIIDFITSLNVIDIENVESSTDLEDYSAENILTKMKLFFEEE